MASKNYIREHLKIQARTASLYQPKVYKALQSQIKAFTRDLKSGGISYAKNRISRHDFNREIGPVVMSLYKMAAVATANRTESILNRSLGVNKKGLLIEMNLKYRTFGHNDRWTEEVLTYFKKHLLDKVVNPISETTKDFILRKLSKGIDEGWSVDRIVKELEGSDITKRRSALIVRTESTRATNYGGMIAAYKNDYEMLKQWNEVKDKRTRLSHRHGSGVGGQTVDLLDRFSNGLLFPGDPDGGAAEVCNCRCVLAYSPKRDKNGRLVPKKKKPATQMEIADEEDINSSVIVNETRTLAHELAELAVTVSVFNAVNKIITDHLN